MLLSAEHISKNYGTKQLLHDVSLYLDEGQKIGIIGVNGTGKSTLLKILAGAEEPDEGTLARDPNIQVSYLPQNPDMTEDATVLEQIFLHFPPEFRALKEYEAKTMLTRLGIADFDAKISTLSGGQRKRVALAGALVHPADVLILDEPTNHLDSEMVAWLEDTLRRFRGGVILVTHDRYFLERVVTKITELTHGATYSYEANYSKYLELREQRRDLTFESAAVIDRESTNWTSALTLNRGTAHGVEKNDCVVSAEGDLVGVVSAVGYNWCTMLTVIDTDTELGARVFRTQEVAVAEGDLALMGEGKLKLSYLSADAQLLSGDVVTTSGLGGFYPGGLVIGTVESVRTGDDGLAQYAVLAPAARLGELSEVFIIKDFDIVD